MGDKGYIEVLYNAYAQVEKNESQEESDRKQKFEKYVEELPVVESQKIRLNLMASEWACAKHENGFKSGISVVLRINKECQQEK